MAKFNVIGGVSTMNQPSATAAKKQKNVQESSKQEARGSIKKVKQVLPSVHSEQNSDVSLLTSKRAASRKKLSPSKHS